MHAHTWLKIVNVCEIGYTSMTADSMKDILHKEVILSSQYKSTYVRFEVFTAVTMKNSVFWDVTSCGSGKN
jgi:hypothetical protein